MIDEDEYTTIMNKYGEIKSESIDGLTINAKKGDSVEMPKLLMSDTLMALLQQ